MASDEVVCATLNNNVTRRKNIPPRWNYFIKSPPKKSGLWQGQISRISAGFFRVTVKWAWTYMK